jgi:hypothetical protein
MAWLGKNLPIGTYYYASRFSRNDGPYYYGGFNTSGGGFWDGVNNVSGVLVISQQPGLIGDYYIPKGTHPKGFPTLDSAFKALNLLGASGPVRFLIDGDLTENGSTLRIYQPSLDDSKRLTIKPAPNKTPTVTFVNCGTSGETAYSGLTIDSTGFVTIDGSNTDGGTTRDMTFLMSDATNGRIVIQLYENTDNIVIKNLKILYSVVWLVVLPILS